ncbi:GTPase Era, mitochondrial [Linepithema humile]|uniref:GTPase Era, mitochondrial n=1 Tax=Linepithema humile TaxID=83485 RepID=UPI00062350B5|nr:PREDICTED: GTPase Era, mitochondrial [Linepithema humile]
MLFTIEKYAIRVGSRYLRRYFSKNVDIAVNNTQEFVLQPEDSFTSIRREGQKSLKIALLGAPNVGKSTLVNQLIKRSVCPTSSKVHTTQAKTNAIYCEDDTQLIFMDTPGTVSENELKRYKLANSFKTDPKVSSHTADIIGIVQDTQNLYTRDKINQNILKLLTEDIRNKIPMILILNKVDKLKKKEILLHLVNVFSKGKYSLNFHDIFMISALTGDGVDDLRTYFLDSAKPGDWQYQNNVYSNLTCEDIIQQTVRAKLLDNLPNEVPYCLQVRLEHFDVGPNDNINAIISVTCPTKRIVNLLLNGKGKRLKNIAVVAEKELRYAFRTSVKLKISVQL